MMQSIHKPGAHGSLLEEPPAFGGGAEISKGGVGELVISCENLAPPCDSIASKLCQERSMRGLGHSHSMLSSLIKWASFLILLFRIMVRHQEEKDSKDLLQNSFFGCSRGILSHGADFSIILAGPHAAAHGDGSVRVPSATAKGPTGVKQTRYGTLLALCLLHQHCTIKVH
eukprot:1158837-Pelagomonas_calceolata.AAC.5